MKEITILAPASEAEDLREWTARYTVTADANVRSIYVEARSSIEIIVAKLRSSSFIGELVQYHISVPNFGVAIPGIGELGETHWISEHLTGTGMPKPDALTVAQVLRDLGNY